MTKSQLIERLAAQNPDLTHREVERIVNAIFETIAADWRGVAVSKSVTSVPSPSRSTPRELAATRVQAKRYRC